MSVKNAELFLEKVADNAELQEKLEKIGADYQGDQKNLRVIVANNILPTARSLGYDFTIEEYLDCVRRAISEPEKEAAESEQLNDDDLDQVVGGIGIHMSQTISAMFRKGLLPDVITLKPYTVGTVQNKSLKKSVIFPTSGNKFA